MKKRIVASLVLSVFAFVLGSACSGNEGDTPKPPKRPHVEITAEPVDGPAPLEVAFTATPQFVRGPEDSMTVVDEDISDNPQLDLEYRWNFQDDSEGAEGEEVTHTYREPGAYAAEVTLIQQIGGEQMQNKSTTATATINVEEPAFGVEVTGPDSSVRVGQSATFDCELTGTEVSSDAFDFQWTFDEPGLSASSQTTTKSFQRTGVHQIICEASIGQRSQRGSLNIQVTENPAPGRTVLNPSPRTGIAPLEVSFSPTVVYGGDNDNLTYEWNFGDGGTSTQRAPTHEYTEPGSYTATLTVTDPDGDRANATATIEVATDERPGVAISKSAQPVTGISPVAVEFEASRSGGNEPIDLQWNFGDGSDTSRLEGPTHTFAYDADADTSVYTVKVTATDADGDTASDTIEITAKQDLPVEGVELTASNESSNNLEGKTVRFVCSADNGNASEDGLTYTFDFGDGETRTQVGEGTTTYTYSDATGAPFAASCQVTDADGDTGSATVEDPIPVIEDTSPTIEDLTASPQQAAVKLDGSVEIDFVSNVEGGNKPLTYEWDFKNGESGTGRTSSTRYETPGNYSVTLTVTDKNGDTDTEVVTVSIGEENTPPDPEVSLSRDCGYPKYIADGNEFGPTPVTVDASGSSDVDGDILTYEYLLYSKPLGSNVDSSSANGSSFTFTPDALGEYVFVVEISDGTDSVRSKKVTFDANVHHDIDLASPTVTGRVDEVPSSEVKFQVTNECGAPLEHISVSMGGENISTNGPRAKDTDENGMVSTRLVMGTEAGDVTLTAQATRSGLSGANSYDTLDFLEPYDSVDSMHTVLPGKVANVLMADRGPIEVSSAKQGEGGQLTFQAADKYFNVVEDNSVPVEFEAQLRDHSDGDAILSSDLAGVGFLADTGDASNGTTETVTIPEGAGEATETIFSEELSTGIYSQVYVKVDNSTITDADGDTLPGDDGTGGISGAEVDLASEDFEDEPPLDGSGLFSSTEPTANGDAGKGTYFETGVPEVGPSSAQSGTKLLGTNLSANYNADWDPWNKNATTNSGDDYTETISASWDIGARDDSGVYPYDVFGVYEMSLDYKVWYDIPRGLPNPDLWSVAGGTVQYSDSSIGTELSLDPGTDMTSTVEYDTKVIGYVDDESGNNSANWSSSDYSGAPATDAGNFTDPLGLPHGNWETVYSGESDGFITESVEFGPDSTPLSGTTFQDISSDSLWFGFRAEMDERISTQRSTPGFYVDDVDFHGIVRALPVEFSATTEAIDFYVSGATPGFDVKAEGVAGSVTFNIEDAFGNPVAEGVEFDVTFSGSPTDAEFLNKPATYSDGNPIGSIVSHSSNRVTLATDDTGKAGVKVVSGTDETITAEASFTNANGIDKTDSITVRFYTCESTAAACNQPVLHLTGLNTSDGANHVRYREGSGWTDQFDAGTETWDARIGGSIPASSDAQVWQRELDFGPGQPYTRGLYEPVDENDESACSSFDGETRADWQYTDQILPISPHKNNEEVEVRFIDSGGNYSGERIGLYIVEDPDNPADTCVTGAQGDVSSNGSLAVDGSDAWEPDGTAMHYLIIDFKGFPSYDVTGTPYDLQLRVNNGG